MPTTGCKTHVGQFVQMNAAPLAAGWQASVALLCELEEQNVELSVFISNRMWTRDAALALIDSGDDSLLPNSRNDQISNGRHLSLSQQLRHFLGVVRQDI